MKRIMLLFIVLAMSMIGHAQAKQRFDGGMMLHTGYLCSHYKAFDLNAKGMAFGLGGTLRFHIGNHLRVGGEGYVSTMKRTQGEGSYARISWGGVVADAYWRLGRWMPYVGGSIGGGKCSTLLVFDGDDNDWIAETNTMLHNESFFFLNPYTGVEFALTETVHLTFKIDRLIPLKTIDMPRGIRCYLGFVFAH